MKKDKRCSDPGLEFCDPYVDEDLSPLDGSASPAARSPPNDWRVKDWGKHFVDYEFGSPIPFANLIGPNPGARPQCKICLDALGGTVLDPDPARNWWSLADPEDTDDGENVRDGFVFGMEGWAFGKKAFFDWKLTGKRKSRA